MNAPASDLAVATRVNHGHSIAPRTFDEAERFATVLAKSGFVPQEYRGKPADIIAAVQFGAELGLGPMQSLQGIAVINGKPCVYGDMAIALVRASHLCEYVVEEIAEDGESATCRVKRRGGPEHTSTFTAADAERAGLWGRKGPWTQYPTRMLQMRARGFALRDQFADVLRGLITTEEAQDYPTDIPMPQRKSEARPPAQVTIEVEPAPVVDAELVDDLEPEEKLPSQSFVKIMEFDKAKVPDDSKRGWHWLYRFVTSEGESVATSEATLAKAMHVACTEDRSVVLDVNDGIVLEVTEP